jgi:amino acid permease
LLPGKGFVRGISILFVVIHLAALAAGAQRIHLSSRAVCPLAEEKMAGTLERAYAKRWART